MTLKGSRKRKNWDGSEQEEKEQQRDKVKVQEAKEGNEQEKWREEGGMLGRGGLEENKGKANTEIRLGVMARQTQTQT